MRRLMRLMPSLGISLTTVAVGLATATVLHAADLYGAKHGWLTVEQVTWGVIQKLGWWYWGMHVVLSVFGLVYAATLDRPMTRWGMATRLVVLVGFEMYIWSPGNTAFGPLSSVLVLLGLVMWLRQQSAICRAKRPKIDLTDAPPIVRAYAKLTTESP